MQINAISISNFCGIENFNAQSLAPIVFVAGHNKVGKSSFIEAINLAITGEYRRVGKKKDFNQLVNSKASKGEVKISTSKGDYNINLPTGSGKQITSESLTMCLSHGAFSAMSVDDQRRAINDLMPMKISDVVVAQELTNRGFDKAVLKLDLSNLEHAVEQAKEFAKQSRAAWQTITGETYGSKKAENWQAVAPQLEAAAIETVPAGRIEHLQQDLEKAISEKAQLQAQIDSAAEHNRRISQLQAKVQGAPALNRQLKQYEKELAENSEKIANLEFVLDHSQQFACPCCQKPLFLQNGELVEATDEVIAKLAGHQNIDTSVNVNDLRGRANYLNQQIGSINAQLANLDEAKAELDKNIAPRHAGQEVIDAIERLAHHIISTRTELERLQGIQREANTQQGKQQQAEAHAKQATYNAMQYHKAIEMWTSAADILSPSGDIGKLLSKSVKDFNDVLSDTEIMDGWTGIKFDYDNGLLFDNRPYHLLSESERWRVDTAVSYAFSKLSNWRIFAVDRFDVLDLPSRLPVMKWLHGLAERQAVDTVIMAGTMKEQPKTPATFSVFWFGDK